VAERLAGVARTAGTMRLGGTDGHRREQADAEEKGDTEDGAGEGRGGERHGAHAADHDAVGESDEDLADVACRDRQGQAEGRAQFAQGFTKRGHGGRETIGGADCGINGTICERMRGAAAKAVRPSGRAEPKRLARFATDLSRPDAGVAKAVRPSNRARPMPSRASLRGNTAWGAETPPRFATGWRAAAGPRS